jgi:hypothetical protein
MDNTVDLIWKCHSQATQMLYLRDHSIFLLQYIHTSTTMPASVGNVPEIQFLELQRFAQFDCVHQIFSFNVFTFMEQNKVLILGRSSHLCTFKFRTAAAQD